LLNSGVAYDSNTWSTFFSANASASAALTGLLFVAASINLARIIPSPLLIARLAKALLTLVGVLLAAELCLVPAQSPRMLGAELVVIGAPVWVMVTILERASSRTNVYIGKWGKVGHFLLAQSAVLATIAGGLSLMAGRDGGLYWVVVGVMISFATALLDAWVLLIEILR
jgi:hypothetical protein